VIKSGQSVVDTISAPFKSEDQPVEKPELVSIVEEIKESSEDVSDDNVYLLNSKGRIDFTCMFSCSLIFIVQEGLIDNSYLSALNAHINYWQDQDVAVFMLRDFYENI
jgi:hypothetical protein